MDNSKKIKEIVQLLETERPKAWGEIPDIELYMDQVLSYMQRQYLALDENEPLTSAMINNYTKKELLPRTKGKRYDRSHIAYLTAICLFKQVLSVTETKAMLDKQILQNLDSETFYGRFLSVLDEALQEASNKLSESMTDEEAGDMILKMAVSSYVNKIVCQKLLEVVK